MISTEDIALFDTCNRLQLYSAFEPPRYPIGAALNESLRESLLMGDPEVAKNHFLKRAADPGLAITGGQIYDKAVHHAALIETIAAYLITDGAWKPLAPLDVRDIRYKPMSYLAKDGRLRRVVLCSRWDELKAAEERTSWRTLADMVATGRPMLINAISIGSTVSGYRPSVWSRCYRHPVAKDLRIKSRKADDDNHKSFVNWDKLYRESTGRSAADWLKLMQADDAFEEVVHSTVVDLPADKERVFEQFHSILSTINNGGRDEMRRSNCYKLSPCLYARCCHNVEPFTPSAANWRKKRHLA